MLNSSGPGPDPDTSNTSSTRDNIESAGTYTNNSDNNSPEPLALNTFTMCEVGEKAENDDFGVVVMDNVNDTAVSESATKASQS